MKKHLLIFAFLSFGIFLKAQSTGNVGINTTTPTATLHAVSKGNTNSTQSLKLQNSTGANLLTINDDGTVSGTAATNLQSGTPKVSGHFISDVDPSGTQTFFVGFNSNKFSNVGVDSYDDNITSRIMPFAAKIEQLTFAFSYDSFSTNTQPITVTMFVNGIDSGFSTSLVLPFITPPFSTFLSPQGNNQTIDILRGSYVSFKVTNLQTTMRKFSISVKYTEL